MNKFIEKYEDSRIRVNKIEGLIVKALVKETEANIYTVLEVNAALINILNSNIQKELSNKL